MVSSIQFFFTLVKDHCVKSLARFDSFPQIPAFSNANACSLISAEAAAGFDGKVLHLSVMPDDTLTLLGVGAGGRVVQAIQRDMNSPRIWDVASAKILNLQIVDSATFRRVTGLDPPPTPISAQTYQQMGLPFYQFAGLDDSSASGGQAAVAGAWPAGLVGAAEAAVKRKKGKRRGGGGGKRQRDMRAE